MSKLTDQLQVTIQGKGDKTLIFANGFGTTQNAWSAQIEQFKRRYRIVTFDLAGSTESAIPAYQSNRHKNLFGFAEDLVHIIDTFDLYGAAYIGHSVSSMIGVLACIAEPNLFSKLIGIGASPRYLNDPKTRYIGGFEEQDIKNLLVFMQSAYVSWANGFGQQAMGNPDRPNLSASFTQNLLSMRPDLAIKIFTTILHSDHRADVKAYGGLSIPTLFIQQQNDVAVAPEVGHWLAARANASLTVLPHEGHFPHIAFAQDINGMLDEFLADE